MIQPIEFLRVRAEMTMETRFAARDAFAARDPFADRVRELHDRALALRHAERTAFLEGECRENEELRARVDALLAVDEPAARLDRLLDAP